MSSRSILFQQATGNASGGNASATPPAAADARPAAAAQPATNPNANLQTSAAGLQAIVGHEREVRRYYNDPVNNCTWGTGFLAHLGPCTNQELGTQVTPQMIQNEYRRRVASTEQAVRRQIGEATVTQEQFDALVSYTYNMGPAGAANVLAAVRNGRNAVAAATMLAHTSAVQRDAHGQVVHDAHGQPVLQRLPGLVTRRQREAAPFLANTTSNTGNQNTPAPTPRATGGTTR